MKTASRQELKKKKKNEGKSIDGREENPHTRTSLGMEFQCNHTVGRTRQAPSVCPVMPDLVFSLPSTASLSLSLSRQPDNNNNNNNNMVKEEEIQRKKKVKIDD